MERKIIIPEGDRQQRNDDWAWKQMREDQHNTRQIERLKQEQREQVEQGGQQGNTREDNT